MYGCWALLSAVLVSDDIKQSYSSHEMFGILDRQINTTINIVRKDFL